MSDLADTALLPEPAIPFDDTILRAYVRREHPGIVAAVLAEQRIEAELTRRNLVVTDDAVQAGADQFRLDRGLLEVEDLESWLGAGPMPRTLDDFETLVVRRVERATLAAALAAGRAEAWFQEHVWRYAHLCLSRIVVEDEGIARELHLLLTEENEDFTALAARYSEDTATCRTGGRCGPETGADAGEEMVRRASVVAPGAILDPFPTPVGWQVVRVDAYAPPLLDAVTRSQIEEDLLLAWLEDPQKAV